MRYRATLLAGLAVGVALFAAAPAFATQVQNLSAVTLSSQAGGVEHVRYSFTFTTTSLIPSSGKIFIAAPGGTTLPALATIHNQTTNTTFSRSGLLSNGDASLQVNLCCSDTINPGDTLTLTLDDVTNPPATTGYMLSISTSGDTDAASTPSYDLSNPEQVNSVTAPSVSTEAAGVQHVRYTFSFKTSSSTGGLVGPGTIDIVAPTSTVLPSVGTITVNGTTTFSRSGTHPGGNHTLRLSLCCSDSIAPGATVSIRLDDVTNPGTAGPKTLDVATSSNPTPVTSPSYNLNLANPVDNVTAPTLSSNAAGVQHVRYSFSFQAAGNNGRLVAPGTITVAAPSGTVLPAVAQIHNDTTGASFSRSATRSNGNATMTIGLCCSDDIAPGDTLTITLDDVTNPAVGSNYTLSVSTSSSPTPVASGTTYSLTAPEQVAGVTGVSLSSAAGGIEHVRYSVGFNASGSTGGLVSPGTIKIDAPPGTVLPAVGTIRNVTSGASFSRSGVRTNGNSTLTLSLCCSDLINPGDQITITLDDVTNAATGGPYTFDVSTSSNPSPVTTPGYSLSAPQQVTDVTPVTTSTNAKGEVSDSFAFKTSVPNGRLVSPGTITIAAPAGTVLPPVARIDNETTGVGFSRSGTRSNGNATLVVSLCCGDEIGPGDTVRVTVDDVTNPAAGAGQFGMSTSSDPLPVVTPPFVPPPPPGPTPVIGKRAAAEVERGVVRIKRPGKTGFVTLSPDAAVPIGSILDTTKGQVGLTFATNASGGTQRGSFSQGQFQVQQSRKNPLTTLSMVGSGLDRCKTKLPKGGAKKPGAATVARKRRRSLFSNVRGRFRTRGRNSTATVRGTKWRVTDTCSGTKTTVTQGTVVVRDLRLRRNIVLKKGQTYLARAPLRKKKRRR